MNKNTKRKRKANPGVHQVRLSRKPKVAASAADITKAVGRDRA